MKSHTTFKSRSVLAASMLSIVTLAACGGESTLTTPTTPKTNGAAPTDDSAPSEPTDSQVDGSRPPADSTPGGISSYSDVQPAVIQIIAEGSFRDPEEGQVSAAGAGSGFIISSDGLAVTNNHVVTGAATLKVFVGGDTAKSYNAKVIGVSECNDLALIDINESSPLPVLEWAKEPIKAGLPIYAAGFPLGDPEFTLTAGIVSKVESQGDMPWASLDSAIEHDAVIQPGNSGGPLVDADGKVIGVNYAFKGGVTSARYQAIRNDLAIPVVERLKTGDFESLGINGDAIVSEDGSFSGIWVAGIAAGSPASDAGMLPGDILQSLNGLTLGSDGTKADYCDVLRTSSDDKPLDAQVLRLDTQEILRGEIRGDQPLAATISLAQEIKEDPATPDAPPAEPEVEVTGYVTVTDDTGVLKISIPKEWADVSTAPQDVEGNKLPFIIASPNLEAYNNENYTTPGLIFTRFPGALDDLNEVLSSFEQDGCTAQDATDVSKDGVRAALQLWTECGGTNTIMAVVAFVPADGSFTGVMLFQATSEADLVVLDEAFSSVEVLG